MSKKYSNTTHLIITLVAMGIIGFLGYGALMRSMNGGCFFGVIAAISGLAGYEIRWYQEAKKSNSNAEK